MFYLIISDGREPDKILIVYMALNCKKPEVFFKNFAKKIKNKENPLGF